MPRSRERDLSLGIAISLVLLLGAFAAQTLLPGPVLAATDRLPNLRMLPLRDWKIETVDGRRLLRFTTIMGNRGPGHFEVRGWRRDSAQTTMRIDQVIFDSAGGSRRLRTGASGSYSGDGHDHWHVQRIMTYELYKVDNPATVRAGAKTGFCFLDTTPWRLDLPFARQRPYYQEEWCGTRRTLANRVGISVGWGDRYPWNFAFQWIDITDLPAGRYVVRATVDIANWYQETNDFDNCLWAQIRIPASGSAVSVLDTGGGCSGAAMTPVDDFPGSRTYDPPARAVIEPGTHAGQTVNALGTQVRSLRLTFDETRKALVLRRSRLPNRDGYWFYVVAGPFDGYWLRDTSRVDLVP